MTTVPEPVMAALDRLNAHARAWGCGKSAIYSYKMLATMTCAIAGEVEAHPIQIQVKCGTCGGDGVYKDYFGGGEIHREACRRCARKGHVILKFVETKIGRFAWHHPYPDSGINLLRAAWKIKDFKYEDNGGTTLLLEDGTSKPLVFDDPGDWRPLKPGEKLIGEPAAELLNTVEAWIVTDARRGIRGEPWWWLHESAMREMRGYDLELPRIDGGCAFCDSVEIVSNLGHMSRGLDYATPVCAAHKPPDPKDWPQLVPGELLTPAVVEWLGQPTRQKRVAA